MKADDGPKHCSDHRYGPAVPQLDEDMKPDPKGREIRFCLFCGHEVTVEKEPK
jgi:hypothetical protein